jgi:hypothetical protein
LVPSPLWSEQPEGEPWLFVEAMAALKLIRRVFNSDSSMRGVLAGQFLTDGSSPTEQTIKRVLVFINAANKLTGVRMDPSRWEWVAFPTWI